MNTNFNPSKKIITFVHIPKTGGTTFKWILRNSFGLSHCDSAMTKTKIYDQKALTFAKKIFPNLKSIAGHNLIQPHNHLEDNKLLLMTLLRNPVKRVVSHIQDNYLRGPGNPNDPIEKIYEKIKSILKNPEAGYTKKNLAIKTIAGNENVEKAKQILTNKYALVGITKHFDKYLGIVEKISPYRININYTKRIVAKNNFIKKKLLENEEIINLIKEKNQKDIKLYNFVEDELFPKYLKKYSDGNFSTKSNYDTYKSRNHPHYLISKYYNKYFYRQIMKLKKNTY